MWSAATCHSRERRQDARIVSRTWPGSIGSAVRNRSLARASPLSPVTSGRQRAPHDMPDPGLRLLLARDRPGPWLATLRCSLAGGRGHRRRRAVVIEPGQGQEVRGLEIVSGEDVHRVTGSTSAAARPGI